MVRRSRRAVGKRRRDLILVVQQRVLDSTALVHLITPAYDTTALQLSILPSFLSRLSPLIHALQISFILPRGFREWRHNRVSSKLSYFALDCLETGARTHHGIANLCVTLDWKCAAVTFGEGEGPAPDDFQYQSEPFTLTFPLRPDNHSHAIFAPIAFYSTVERRFVPLNDGAPSSLPPHYQGAATIQLSLSSTPAPCFISRLPVELLSLVFSYFNPPGECYELSDVCWIWRAVSAPYWDEPDSAKVMHSRLKRYPGAGRLWRKVWFPGGITIRMVKEVIAGSANVTSVRLDAFWGEEESKVVLSAIEGLERLEEVSFENKGSRKWKKEEVENFTRRMGVRIRNLRVEDCSSSPAHSASTGLQLSHGLISLTLRRYPPLQSLSLPHTVLNLTLSHLCPLPPSISTSRLPPLLQTLKIELGPFSSDGPTSIQRAPLDLSHLKNLTSLWIDGGEETSNLVCGQFFQTLTNATSMYYIHLAYCLLDSSDFPEFVRWFFADRMDANTAEVEEIQTRRYLYVLLFFGAWHDEEIEIARRAIKECTGNAGNAGLWQSGEEPST